MFYYIGLHYYFMELLCCIMHHNKINKQQNHLNQNEYKHHSSKYTINVVLTIKGIIQLLPS